MANPSNKKTGQSYLSSLKKEELIDRLLAKEAVLMELEENNKKLLADYNSLKKEFNSLNRKYNKLSNEDLTKRVLEFKARNLVPTAIREKLILEGQDINLNVIKDIYNSELNLELELYYKQCVEKYLETIRINTTLYKQSSIDEINRLLGYAYENLQIVDQEDVRTKQSIMDSISSYIEKRDKLMKNIDEHQVDTEEENILNESMEEFKNFTANIFNFSTLGSVEKIGGENETK